MWLEDLLDFWFPEDRGLSDAAEARGSLKAKYRPRTPEIAGSIPAPDKTSASSLSPLPDIPEMFKRHIPCEPCPSALEEAERVLRR